MNEFIILLSELLIVAPFAVLALGLIYEYGEAIIYGLLSSILFLCLQSVQIPDQYHFLLAAIVAAESNRLIAKGDDPNIELMRIINASIYINLFGWIVSMSYIGDILYNALALMLCCLGLLFYFLIAKNIVGGDNGANRGFKLGFRIIHFPIRSNKKPVTLFHGQKAQKDQ